MLSYGADMYHGPLYELAIGRCLALMAHNRVANYENKVLSPANTDHGNMAKMLITILTNMAKSAVAWKRTKDLYLFQQIRAKMVVARSALLGYGENTMGAIARQLETRETNTVVNRLIQTAPELSRIFSVSDWETSTYTELFVMAVSVLQEILDCEIPLLINHEIPYHINWKIPCFVLITMNFATKGTRFGYVCTHARIASHRRRLTGCHHRRRYVHREEMYFPDLSHPYPIPETILGWVAACLDVADTPALESLNQALTEPESIVGSHKLAKFLH